MSSARNQETISDSNSPASAAELAMLAVGMVEVQKGPLDTMRVGAGDKRRRRAHSIRAKKKKTAFYQACLDLARKEGVVFEPFGGTGQGAVSHWRQDEMVHLAVEEDAGRVRAYKNKHPNATVESRDNIDWIESADFSGMDISIADFDDSGEPWESLQSFLSRYVANKPMLLFITYGFTHKAVTQKENGASALKRTESKTKKWSKKNGMSAEYIAHAIKGPHVLYSAFSIVKTGGEHLSFDASEIEKKMAAVRKMSDEEEGDDEFDAGDELGDDVAAEPELPMVHMDEVAEAVESTSLLSPAVYLVGELPCDGATTGTIDLYVDGSFDDETRTAIQLAVGKMLASKDPALARRVRWLDGSNGFPDGPHVALFDLDLKACSPLSMVHPKSGVTKAEGSFPAGERGSHDAVMQLHFRGASVHGDFRVKFGETCEGWTMNMQKPGKVQPVDTVAQARKVASGISLLGNTSLKPLRDGRVMAEPKDSGPAEWVEFDNRVFEPGEAGASPEKEGVLIAVARPTVELGRQEEAFREYFLSLDRWMVGVLMLRRIAGDGKDGEPYWVASMGKTWLPSVLKSATVKAGVMPQDGASWMPETLERETPKEWRFWELSGADAKAARDALVKSGWFTEQNVRMVDGEFHRLVTKFFPTPTDPEKPEVVTEKTESDPWGDFVKSLPTQKAEFKPLARFTPMKPSPETTFTKMDEIEASFATEDRLKAGIIVEPAFKGATVVLEKDADGKVLAFFADKTPNGPITETFKGVIAAAAESLPDGSVIVGELVIGDKPAVKCSDALYLDGESLVTQGCNARSASLGKMLGARGKGALQPTPQRVAHNVPALRAAVEWASAIPGADGAVLKCSDAPYSLTGKSSEMARLNLVRQLRVVVLVTEKDVENLNVLTCGIGPLVNGSDAKSYASTMEHNGNVFIVVGKSEPTKIDAQVGQVVRVIPSGMRFVDSENGKAVTCSQMTVEERVKMRPNTVEEVNAMSLGSERAEKRIAVSILKADAELRYVLGVVLEPNDGEGGAPDSPDAHKDIYSFDDVRDAAWLYLSEHHQIGLMHQSELATADYQVCESYLAPVDFELGGQKILKGSWLLGARILNDAVWQKVKTGKLNAWSIDGRAIRTPEPAADAKTTENDDAGAVA